MIINLIDSQVFLAWQNFPYKFQAKFAINYQFYWPEISNTFIQRKTDDRLEIECTNLESVKKLLPTTVLNDIHMQDRCRLLFFCCFLWMNEAYYLSWSFLGWTVLGQNIQDLRGIPRKAWTWIVGIHPSSAKHNCYRIIVNEKSRKVEEKKRVRKVESLIAECRVLAFGKYCFK